MSKKTTMTDIAKALGVSQTLVSFVLSGKNDMGISNDTKKKVLMTAEKMGYCPSTAAKIIRLGRSGYGTLIFSEPSVNGLADIIAGINRAFERYGYSLIVHGDPKKKSDVEACKKLILEKKTDGFIVFTLDNKIAEDIFPSDIPYVTLTGTDAASAEKCAAALCEKILSCGENAVAKKKSSANTARKKVVVKTVKKAPVTQENKTEQPKKTESIWLL